VEISEILNAFCFFARSRPKPHRARDRTWPLFQGIHCEEYAPTDGNDLQTDRRFFAGGRCCRIQTPTIWPKISRLTAPSGHFDAEPGFSASRTICPGGLTDCGLQPSLPRAGTLSMRLVSKEERVPNFQLLPPPFVAGYGAHHARYRELCAISLRNCLLTGIVYRSFVCL